MNNFCLSDLKCMSLTQALKTIGNVNIKYRDVLDRINPDFTFGTEIEFENYDYKKLDYLFWKKDFLRWKSIYERTVLVGGEVVSPILSNQQFDWQELKDICHILKEEKVIIGENCGGHIHIGAHILEGNIDYWLSLLKIWTIFEPVIYKFGYGEKGTGRTLIDTVAKPFNKDLKKVINSLSDNKNTSQLIYLLKEFKRNYAINFRNSSWDKSEKFDYKNTIEFRLFNGSINEVIWQNNINMLLNLFSTIKSSKYDKEWIDYHFDKGDITNDLDSAIIFADMIYTSELDKLYFLRQYLQKEYLKQDKKYVKTI